MLTVADALSLVLQHARPLPAVEQPLSASSLGLVLAQDVASDLDMPPYTKSLMDGYAVRTADLAHGCGDLHVVEEITAGKTPQVPLGPGQAARIMTGAPLPVGADAVVMVERTQLLANERVQIDDPKLVSGANILPQGREMHRGETILHAATLLRPQELGLLATLGRATAQVIPRPQVAVLSTGDEVVDAPQVPGPGQIRNSNGPMLAAQVSRAGGVPGYLGIARDKPESLRPAIADGLQAPMLILSGGVSAGKLDLVPGILQELGVQAHFHKVQMKPGKPIFFGTRGDCLVFGLPGNPVSSLVCFELFVRPAIRRLLGYADHGPVIVHAELAENFFYKTDRPTYHPALLEAGERGWRVRMVPWFGSADLRAIAAANAFAVFQAGEHRQKAGEWIPVLKVE